VAALAYDDQIADMTTAIRRALPYISRNATQPKGIRCKLLNRKRRMMMKPIPQSIVTIALFSLTMIVGYGCSRQFPSVSESPYPLPLALEAPIDSEYPGTRELMDAPSNDPALNNDRNGVELRP